MMSKQPKSTLAELLESFFRKHLIAQRGASTATAICYRDALRLFLTFASEQTKKRPGQLRIEELDRDMVLAFLDHLERERGNSTRTRNCRLAAIHSFFHYAALCDPAFMNLASMVLGIQGKKTTKPVLGYIHQPDLEAILAAPDRGKPQGRRDHALLLFLARTGARVSEAIGVNVGDLTFDWPLQVLLRGKGAKQRIVPLSKDTISVLRAHVEQRRVVSQPQAPVFVNARGQRLSRFGVIHILRQAVSITIKTRPIAGSNSISPHTLRHSLAMGLLQSGVDPATIQAWLGHATLNTTHQYMEADLEMKRRALEKCGTPETMPAPYRPSDEVLTFLESL
jgi:site-specific recombinase XerD